MESKHTVKTKCKFCRREFDSFALKKVCPECEFQMDDQFAVIRQYLKEHPEATIGELCDNLDVPSALIKYYLKEERLSIREKDKNYFLKCESCNTPIQSGRFCRRCELTNVKAEAGTIKQVKKEVEEMERAIIHHKMRTNKVKSSK